MVSENPFSLNFGIKPHRIISRRMQIEEIINTFNSSTPGSYIYIITGVRGAGKTVTMASVINELQLKKDWIVITLNPNRDLLSAMAAGLFGEPLLKPVFLKADIAFSLGVDISLSTEGPMDLEIQIKRMLDIIKKSGKRVLIAIDEAVNNKNFRIFSSAYQMFLYEGYPLFCIMTGLYDNIRSLQDEKNLTFLYRAPKFELKPLSVISMSNDYREVFDISEEEALEMARFTKGYSYAFQVLGYLRYKRNKPITMLIPEFDEIMEEYSYEKIWSELSKRDKDVVKLLAKNGKMKVQGIIKELGMTSGSFSTYRRRLGKGGIISVEEYGYCELCLPRFGDIVDRWGLNLL